MELSTEERRARALAKQRARAKRFRERHPAKKPHASPRLRLPGETTTEYHRRRYHEDPAWREKVLTSNRALNERAKDRGYKQPPRHSSSTRCQTPKKPLTEAQRIKHRLANALWKKLHPEAVRTMRLKRRAWEKGAQTTEQVSKDYIYELDNGLCHICGKKVLREKMTFDHLIPLSQGGTHTAANIALAHRACNSRRGAGRLPAQLRLVG
jgi:5-methylcytosine-specific restriction endonuclease McrA